MTNYILSPKGELRHYGILGMKWGVRRYQKRNGQLTDLGRRHLAERNIRTEDDLNEKTIPKGTIMYRTTPYEQDNSGSKSTYVTYLDVDRNMYKSGQIVNAYTDKEIGDNSAYEHEFELKTDIRIPSIKTVREIEKRLMSDAKHRQEVGKAYVESMTMLEGVTPKDLGVISNATDKLIKATDDVERRRLYEDLVNKYGDDRGDFYYHEAISMKNARSFVDLNDPLTVERSLGRAHVVKDSIISELQKQGYNAMYDNASIGVDKDGSYSKNQEGVEPLLIFDRNATLKETGVRELNKDEQRKAYADYNEWRKSVSNTLRDFK